MVIGTTSRLLTWSLEYQHIPFDYDKKAVFGVKVAAYLITGFAVPFVAAYYQLYVSIMRCGRRGAGLTRCAGASPLARHRLRLACTYRRPANLYRRIPLELDGLAFVSYPMARAYARCHRPPRARSDHT